MPHEEGLYAFIQEPDNPAFPPLVLIHGAGGNHLSWPSSLRRLSGHTIYAVDLPGHGKSGGHGEQTLGAYADRLAEWMDAVRLHRAFFLGHSMGGGIALELALHHAHRTAGIGLVASGARLPVPPRLLEYSANPATYPSALEILRADSFGSRAPRRLVDLTLQRLEQERPTVLHNDLVASVEFDASDRLETIRHPALVICGTEDRLAPLRQSQFLANRIPGAELHVIQEAGHMVTLEKPLEVAAAVAGFLKALRGRY